MSDKLWYKAALTPAATGLFTESFYPEPNRVGTQYVFFTQVDLTPNTRKIIVASKMASTGLRMLTQELAMKCLIPGAKATKAESAQLNELSKNMKI